MARRPSRQADTRLGERLQRRGWRLNGVGSAYRVLPELATVPQRSQGISMSPGRDGSGATRIEADLSIKRGEMNSMRKASLVLAALGLALLALPGVASAAPEVSFKAEAVPITGFPGTGNILGAGAAVQAEYKIKGTEYGGFPPPIVGVNFYLPSGTKLHTSGFPTCAKAVLEQTGPRACPKSSAAGPVGHVLGIVAFGSERVEEAATLESFYAPGGGIEFFTDGHSPVSLEILSSGHYISLGGAGGYGPELVTEVPLVSTVPGADYASVESISVKAGSAHKVHGKPVYYGTVPKKCPKGGFPIKTEVIFDENGANPIVPETVTATYKSPCPRK
jgi:hypothetical protein